MYFIFISFLFLYLYVFLIYYSLHARNIGKLWISEKAAMFGGNTPTIYKKVFFKKKMMCILYVQSFDFTT